MRLFEVVPENIVGKDGSDVSGGTSMSYGNTLWARSRFGIVNLGRV